MGARGIAQAPTPCLRDATGRPPHATQAVPVAPHVGCGAFTQIDADPHGNASLLLANRMTFFIAAVYVDDGCCLYYGRPDESSPLPALPLAAEAWEAEYDGDLRDLLDVQFELLPDGNVRLHQQANIDKMAFDLFIHHEQENNAEVMPSFLGTLDMIAIFIEVRRMAENLDGLAKQQKELAKLIEGGGERHASERARLVNERMTQSLYKIYLRTL
ncbi:MAG: hypothetical protein SGPRY_011020, partial [Prymnesium sp.]